MAPQSCVIGSGSGVVASGSGAPESPEPSGIGPGAPEDQGLDPAPARIESDASEDADIGAPVRGVRPSGFALAAVTGRSPCEAGDQSWVMGSDHPAGDRAQPLPCATTDPSHGVRPAAVQLGPALARLATRVTGPDQPGDYRAQALRGPWPASRCPPSGSGATEDPGPEPAPWGSWIGSGAFGDWIRCARVSARIPGLIPVRQGIMDWVRRLPGLDPVRQRIRDRTGSGSGAVRDWVWYTG